MSTPLPITIVGGGLAGLTLGIALRQQGVPVVVYEASHYPRHRVCGEFISGNGLGVLENLGLLKVMQVAGSKTATNAAFFSPTVASPVRTLPTAALCLSRLKLDALLASELRKFGGEVKENTRWREPFGDGTIRSTGRRMKAMEGKWRWFGLKVHARNVRLSADLEMHFTDRGYVGLCGIENDEVNICGLFRSQKTEPNLARDWKEWLCGAADSALRERLASARFDEASFCSVAGLSLQANRATDQAECSVGDAISMIPPVTGNGMSMAFESAQIAAAPLAKYSRKEISWAEARTRIARECDGHFQKRLFWSGLLQRALVHPGISSSFLRLGASSETIWKLLFHKTR